MPKPEAQIRTDLREKLGGISPQSLSNRVRKVKDAVPAPPSHALYVLAFLHGLQLDKYLDAETLAEAADWVERYRSATSGGDREIAEPPPRKKPGTPSSPRQVVVKVTGAEFKDIPQFMVPLTRPAELAAERAYPIVFLFENSLRELVTRVLHAQYGKDWWDEVPPTIRDKAADNKSNEAKDKWHTPRGSEPIQYIDLMDLSTIIVNKKLWPHFKPLFPRKDWVSNLIHGINVSRRIVAHMNVLHAADIQGLQADFRKWAKQLKAHEQLIP